MHAVGYQLRRIPTEDERIAESIKVLRKAGESAVHAVGYQLRRIPTEDERIAESIKVLRKAGESAVHAVGYQLRRIPTENKCIAESIKVLHNAGFGKSELSRRTLECAIRYFSYSKSQLFQDIFVLTVLREKRNGFFVEFGAGDGVTFSNTYMLEKEFGWTGILAEPNRTFFPVAAKRSCAVDGRCIWSATGETVSFTETTKSGELSTISQFAQCDSHDRGEKGPIEYQVKTVSLNDLLVQHHAPAEIDYLSIDTEGSELAILGALDFKRWRFNVITVEHNWVQSAREGIHALLTSHGYSRVMTEFSFFDDWYIGNELPTP